MKDAGAIKGRLSIGALARASGIAVDTLRTWERRYGYPVPERKPSGHRVYPVASVPRLRRIAEALARGHRAGEVLPASDEVLQALLGAGVAHRRPPTPPADPDDLLAAVGAFDADHLTRTLTAEWGRLGPLDFLQTRVAPLVHAVGEAWADGRLEIRHEHFLSERVGDLLRALRLPFEERAGGPLVILASLPGERHALGLQMAALLLASLRCRVLFLGTDVPVAEVASLATDMAARAVGVSVSLATRGARMTTTILRLRTMLPRRMTLLVGGAGAPRPREGLTIMPDLVRLDAWARAVVLH